MARRTYDHNTPMHEDSAIGRAMTGGGRGFSKSSQAGDVTLHQATLPVIVVTVSPLAPTVAASGAQQFTAAVTKNGATVSTPTIVWSVPSGGARGSVSAGGLFTAVANPAAGPVTVRATYTDAASGVVGYADAVASVTAAPTGVTTAQILDNATGVAFKARGTTGVLATWRADEFADTTAFLNAIPRFDGNTVAPGVATSKDMNAVIWTGKGSDATWYDTYHAGTVSAATMPLFAIATDHPNYTLAKYLKLKVPKSTDPLAAADYKAGQITLRYNASAQQVRTRFVLGFLNPFTTQGNASAVGSGALKLHATGWATGSGSNRVEFTGVSDIVHIANAGGAGGIMDDTTNVTHNVMGDAVTDSTYTSSTKGSQAPFTNNTFYLLEIDEITATDKRSCRLKSRWAPISSVDGSVGTWIYLHDKTVGVTNATDLTAQTYADFIMNFNYPPTNDQYIAVVGMQALDLVAAPGGF